MPPKTNWFDAKNAQTRAGELLGQFQLDEGAIEAEAFRLSSEDLERLVRMLTLAEVRREKALRFVADYREGLSTQLQHRPSLQFWKKAGQPKCVAAGADEAHLKRGVRPRSGNARPSDRGRH